MPCGVTAATCSNGFCVWGFKKSIDKKLEIGFLIFPCSAHLTPLPRIFPFFFETMSQEFSFFLPLFYCVVGVSVCDCIYRVFFFLFSFFFPSLFVLFLFLPCFCFCFGSLCFFLLLLSVDGKRFKRIRKQKKKK